MKNEKEDKKELFIIRYIKSFKEFIPTWIICVFMFFGIFIYPLIIAVVLLAIQTIQLRKIKEKLIGIVPKTDCKNPDKITPHHKKNSFIKCVLYVLASIFLIFMLLTVVIGVSSDMEEKKAENNVSKEIKKEDKKETKKEEPKKEKEEVKKEENKEKINTIEVITDEKLKEDFINACSLVGIEYDKIKNMEKEKDWDSGERYSFTYAEMPFRLYSNMDSTVNTIKLREDIDLYKQGYEPYTVDDYIVNVDEAVKLQILCEDLVKDKIKYPDTAKFPVTSWRTDRNKNIYTISNNVKCKNAFGVKSTLPFSVTYGDFGKGYELIYFGLDNDVIVDKTASLEQEERKKIDEDDNNSENNDTQENTNSIILTYGELGEYGKTINYDGIETISYFVPNGTYTVKNKVKWCKVNVAKDEYYKNSDGYMENEIVNTVEFSEYEQQEVIDVPVGTHIELTINATIELAPIE